MAVVSGGGWSPDSMLSPTFACEAQVASLIGSDVISNRL